MSRPNLSRPEESELSVPTTGLAEGADAMPATTRERLYKTDALLKRTLRVSYPAGRGRVILRTELDWEKDVEAMP